MTPQLTAEIVALLSKHHAESTGGLDEIATWVPSSAHKALAHLLRDNGYTMYVTVVASHWPEEKVSRRNPNPEPEHFQVATVLRNPARGASSTFGWRVRLQPGEAIDSLVSVFAGADWQEREQYDLVGVVFRGHPDLRRLMMPEDWPGHPLRKDYAIDTAHFPWR